MDGALVSTIGMDGLVRVWPTAPSAPAVVTRPAAATHVAFSGDGRYLASDGEDGSVLFADLSSGERRVERDHAGRVYGVEAATVGSLFVTAGNDGHVVVWDAAKGTHEVYSGHEGRVRTVQLGAAGHAV